MEFLKICGIAAICCVAVLLFVNREKELTAAISALIYIVVMLYAVSRVGEVLSTMQTYFQIADMPIYFPLLLKVIGVSLIGGVASAICDGTGQRGASRAIDLMAVLEILYISMPIFKELFEKIAGVFGE